MEKIVDIEIYKNLYEDLKDLSNDDILEHYKNYGKNENRIISYQDFYEKYPYFRIYLYKYFNDDLENLSNIELYSHYINYGCNENRISGYIDFYKYYPDFNLEFYRSLYKDLENLSENELYIHYHKYGKWENRIINLNIYKNRLLNFDLDFYKLFNPSINYDSLNKYFNQYLINSNHKLNFDYKIINYTKSFNINHPYYNQIKDHYYYRKITNYKELLEYNSKLIKKCNIYQMDDFFKYYNDFDYEYYKNRYFKNSLMSKVDILYYYHTKGKYRKEIINNKYKIIIYTPPFDINCGGIVVMHNLAKMINDLNHPKFYAKLYIYNYLRYENIFCNDFVNDINEINDNTIVIYPETISGNPLNCNNIVRWVLLELGIEMPNDHYKNWNQNDLIYYWEPKDKYKSKILRYHWINSIFKNHNKIRNKTCYLLKKGRLIHKNIKEIHPKDSICIENLELEEIANTFNKSTYFYCYDPKTMYIIFAIFCGCVPIIYPIENLSKIDYLKQSIFKKENILLDKGIAYGNTVEEINFASKTLKEAKNDIILLLQNDINTINNFIDDLLIYFNNKNSEKLVYCLDKFKY